MDFSYVALFDFQGHPTELIATEAMMDFSAGSL